MTDDRLRRAHRQVIDWYDLNERPLPWRDPECSPWGVLVSEVMSQQTPVARVEPAWRAWMQRWPTPADLAEDSPGEAVRMWQRLGYPRRALRLWEAARVIVAEHDGAVPREHAALLALPGVGAYTAAAVASFAFGDPQVVLDTNVRRVNARLFSGLALPSPAGTAAETRLAAEVLPTDRDAANRWNAAAMELGALVCTARSPRCGECPARDVCAWQEAGAPPYDGPPRRGQAWHGTDRQARGALLAVLRGADEPVRGDELRSAWAKGDQAGRALASLIEDGLVEPLAEDRFRLPA